MEEVFNSRINNFNSKISIIETNIIKLEKLIKDSDEKVEGNSVYTDKTLEKPIELIPKQINLFTSGFYINKKACEIGFNAGHSTFFILLGANVKNNIEYTIFDIAEHKYTMPCFIYVASQFPEVKFEFYKGNSIKEMENFIIKNKSSIGTYDLVHVDGGHSLECIKNDMYHADLLLKKDGVMIVDDTNVDYINNMVNCYLTIGKYTEINDIFQTIYYPHRMIKKIKD